MTLGVLIALAVIGVIAVFLYRNPQLLGKAERNARIKADQALDKGTSAVEREKDAVKQIADKIPAQRRLVAEVQSTVDSVQRQYDAAVKNRDGLKTQYETMKGRVSDAALDKISQDYVAAKKQVSDFDTQLAESKNNAAEAEKTLVDFEGQLKKAEAGITTDEGRAALAAAYRQTAALRNEINGMNSSLSAVGAARTEVEHDLDVARHENENSQGSKTDREIADAQSKLDAENARKELEGDLTGGDKPASK